VAQIAINRELGAQERRAKLRDQFLRRIGVFAEAVAQITVKASRHTAAQGLYALYCREYDGNEGFWCRSRRRHLGSGRLD
jgi:hypothetical protein